MIEEEKFKVNYNDGSPFKGIRILYKYLEEGIEYAKKNKIEDVCIWQGMDTGKYDVDFDFLKELSFLKTFHCLVFLTKKSNIEGLYSLTNLKDFRWAVDNDFIIDFGRLHSIEKLNINYNTKLKNWNCLNSLKELYISKVDDCSFLSGTESLEKIRFIKCKFTSLKGLESCVNITEIDIRFCQNLTEVTSTVTQLKKLDYLVIDSCKKLVIDEEYLKQTIKHVGII
ncbi:hypothetical protein [Flavobacterium tructae]|uniref:hypothetical protein n=1 Tax=Flavobacterium tructae TaxID=1114873 RepID=UPI0035A9597B